jgi:uncharacterized protein YceK
MYLYVKPIQKSLVVHRLDITRTIKTLYVEENKVDIKHPLVKTNCDEIYHVYSGVQYNLCLLHSERKTPHKLHVNLFDRVWLASVDIIFSSVMDTVVLPYTTYQQIEYGSLKVNK